MRLSEVVLCARHLLWLTRTRRWDADRIWRYQRGALGAMLAHAAATVPYYRALGVPIGSDAGASLAAFPPLTKALVQEQATRLLSDAYDPASLHVSRTSGSTGRPTVTYYDPAAWILTRHALKLRRVLEDLRPPYRVLVIGEEPAERTVPRASAMLASCRVSIHDGAAGNLAAIGRFQPTGIYGSPSWLLELVQTAQRDGRPLPRAQVVWTSSEVLTQGARAEIGAAFGCAVRDVYGSTEFKEVAAECAHGRLHVNFESSYVEVLRGEPSETGAILITSLVNRAMPLIRYRIGDIGRLVTGVSCGCGRAAPWLADIGGRVVDLIALSDGRKISPYLLSTVVEAYAAIARWQLLERVADEIEVRYQLRPTVERFDPTPMGVELARVVGGGVKFSFARVADLDRTPAGKLRPLIRSAEA